MDGTVSPYMYFMLHEGLYGPRNFDHSFATLQHTPYVSFRHKLQRNRESATYLI